MRYMHDSSSKGHYWPIGEPEHLCMRLNERMDRWTERGIEGHRDGWRNHLVEVPTVMVEVIGSGRLAW